MCGNRAAHEAKGERRGAEGFNPKSERSCGEILPSFQRGRKAVNCAGAPACLRLYE